MKASENPLAFAHVICKSESASCVIKNSMRSKTSHAIIAGRNEVMVMLDFAVDELDGGKLSTACGERLLTQEQNLFKTTFYLHCLQIGMIFTINTFSHVENEKLATQNISGLH